MAQETHKIRDPQGNPVTVQVQRDKRLKKSARWVPQKDGTILLRVPFRTSRWQIPPLLDDIARGLSRLEKKRAQIAARTDGELQARAEHLNKVCFNGHITWTSIRWVGNMEKRLGSCTTGGPTDGAIRISEQIRRWPQWVIDYVIAHELAHRVHPNHSKTFWAYLEAGYPLTERARGFIQGMGFAQGTAWEEDEAD